MGKKYSRYKNSLETFLGSEKGKRFFNIFYSIGASVVIVGALFKINHWRGGTEILMIGMIAEAVIFFISAFDLPAREYKWDRIFPRLNRKPSSEPQDDATEGEENDDIFAGATVQGGTTNISGGGGFGGGVFVGGSASAASSASNIPTSSAGGGAATTTGGGQGGTVIIGGGGGFSPATTVGDPVEMQEASETYSEQLTKLAESMGKFAEVTESLTKVSDTLLNSFKSVTDNSDGIGLNTQGYITQMENLNRNIAGLNTIYEIQLKGVSGQIHTIEEVNAGLERIKHLYSGSLVDSSIFKNETEKMARQLTELNQVYSRMLHAMTTNMTMNMGGGGYNPYNPANLNNPGSDKMPEADSNK
ncbi:archaellum component FlaC [Dysgonomonas sp. PH5-45]|uniref:type IX secretion system motor protein PorL/GldL n=1 Tax=unclassified Dysgonomonas TaxID=2630389 RepID=UPI002474AB98|nr:MULTISPECIES: gliding motility protein GldL [unclassified Dysgonomonas]MDH6353820.1 archaellum component FlaC [Dysgonomonas sp. PH5-45]MDH6386722.1 archaellum component FlaC [Dysgonomonas sp. PH5-37]